MIEQISNLISEIRTPLLEAGMKPSRIAFKRERLEKVDQRVLETTLAWLKLFKENELAAYLQAKSLVNDLTLSMYALSGMAYKTHEELQIKTTKEAMFSTWKMRPWVLRRDNEEDPKAKTPTTGKGKQRAKANSKNDGRSNNK